MSISFGYCVVKDNATTALLGFPTGADAKWATGWAVGSANAEQGYMDIAADNTGRLTLRPGRYRVSYQASVEPASTSGISDCHSLLMQGGANYVDGSKCIVTSVASDTLQMSGTGYLTVTDAMYNSGANYVELWLGSARSHGLDVLVREAILEAVKVG